MRGKIWRIIAPMFLVLAIVAYGQTAKRPTVGKPWSKKPDKEQPQMRGLLAEAVPTPQACVCSAAPLDVEEREFLRLINEYRVSKGAGALQVSVTLTNAARWMSQSMATLNYFSHTDSLGRDPFVRMGVFGYNFPTYRGENIAAGNAVAANTFTQWRLSAGHNANMLNPSFKAIGIGRALNPTSAYRAYWTTDFGGVVDQVLAVQ